MKKITFVVGAGASSEFGLPTGKRLLEIISGMASINFNGTTSSYAIDSDLIHFLSDLSNAPSHSSEKETEFMRLRDEAVWLSKVALMAPSIDNLLHSHRQNPELEKIGKAFICKAILNAESTCFLANKIRYDGHYNHFDLMRQTADGPEYISNKWVGKLFSLLVEMRDFNEFLSALDRIEFICFNYDRCIEIAMTSLAYRYYRLTDLQGQDVLDHLKITHVYGSLGPLTVKDGVVHNFGNVSSGLSETIRGIKTFTSQDASGKVKNQIKDSFANAHLGIFLGYGFLEINNLILYEGGPFNLDCVFATAKGLSEASVSVMQAEMGEMFLFGRIGSDAKAALLAGGRPDKIVFNDFRCAELIDHHSVYIRRTLAG